MWEGSFRMPPGKQLLTEVYMQGCFSQCLIFETHPLKALRELKMCTIT